MEDEKKKYTFTADELAGAFPESENTDVAPKSPQTAQAQQKQAPRPPKEGEVASESRQAVQAPKSPQTERKGQQQAVQAEEKAEPLQVQDVSPLPFDRGSGTEPPSVIPPPDLTSDIAELASFQASHPWVTTTDYAGAYKEWKDLTPQKMLSDMAQYRKLNGGRLESWEIPAILAGRDPVESEREVRRTERRAAWAERLNAIGDVLNHFMNFGRAMGGNPIAQVQNTYDSGQAARLREAHDRLRRQHYADYVNALTQQYKHQEDMEREKRAYQYKLGLLREKNNGPQAQQQLRKQAADAERAEYDAQIKKLQLLGWTKKDAEEAVIRRKRADLLDAQIARQQKGGTSKGAGKEKPSGAGTSKYIYYYKGDDGSVRGVTTPGGLQGLVDYALRKKGWRMHEYDKFGKNVSEEHDYSREEYEDLSQDFLDRLGIMVN